MMEQGALARYQALVMENARNHRSAEEIISDDDFKAPFLHELRCYAKNGAQTRQLYIDESYDLLEANEDGILVHAEAEGSEPDSSGTDIQSEQKVLFLHCEGPVTRGGGMCSYGSIDFRNIMQEYAEDPSVAGMVFLTDTPGGDAMAMYDFEDGMRAWKAAGKRSIQLVDGYCYSAGEAMGCQCDFQIAVNAHDGFDCIGAMISGFLTPADSENTITHERFIHVVAKQTPDKNAMWEKAAKGDTAEVKAWVSESAQDFIDMMKSNRPDVKDEHLTGKIYEAKDVMGSLCDGIGTIDDAIHYCLTGEMAWQAGSEPTPEEDPEIIAPEDDENKQADDVCEEHGSQHNTQQNNLNLNKKDMNLLQKIALALGIKDEAEIPANEQEVETPATEQTTGAEESVTTEPALTTEEPEGTEATTTEESVTEEPEGTEAATTEEPATEEPEGTVEENTEEESAGIEQQLVEQVAQYDAQITVLQQQLQEQVDVAAALAEANTAALQKKDVEIAAKAGEVLRVTELLTAKESEVALLTEKVTKHETLLAECKSELEAKDATINAHLSAIQNLNAQIAELQEENKLLKAVGAAPKTPAPAPAVSENNEADYTPDEFKEGMTAQEMIEVQKKRTARRKKA